MIPNRVCNQTNEEWLREYETGVVKPAGKTCRQLHTLELVFDHHRTARTKSGSVILCFVEVATGEDYVVFFNADLTWQRSSRKGQLKKIGVGGQFLPPKRGKFRKWWIKTVGAEPKRWSAVHKEITARLKDLKFTGDTDISYKKDGQPFNRIKEVRLLKPQVRNNLGTSEEQSRDTPF